MDGHMRRCSLVCAWHRNQVQDLSEAVVGRQCIGLSLVFSLSNIYVHSILDRAAAQQLSAFLEVWPQMGPNRMQKMSDMSNNFPPYLACRSCRES